MTNPQDGQTAAAAKEQGLQASRAGALSTANGGGNAVTEIDLLELFYRLLAAWKLIAILALCGMLLAFGYTWFFVTPQYQASSTIYVVNRKDSAINVSDLQIGSALTQDYIKVFNMWEVHEEVISNLNLPYSYGQMKRMLSVKNESNTRMLDITVTCPDPKLAADIANEYAVVACDFIAETMSTTRPNIVSVALVPANPVSPSMVKNVAIGFLAGVVLACGIVFLQMILDDKIKTAEDIRKVTGLVNLAIVPRETISEPKAGGTHKRRKAEA